MGDRVSKFIIAFDGDSGDLQSVLTAVKGQFRSAVSEIEATTRKVTLFADLETKTKASAEALLDATTKVKLLAAELEKIKATGGTATEDLTKGLREANREVTTATNAYNRNVDALTKMQAQLTKTGVDTSNLARATLKLAEAQRAAAAAADQQAAKQLLGVKTMADIHPQIAKLNAAYQTLKESGTLSAREIAIAQTQLQARIRETHGEVTKLGSGIGGLGAGFSSLLMGAAARFLGITSVIGTMTAVIGAGVAAAKELKQGLAEISIVTNLTKEQLDALGTGVRALATTIGFDLKDGLKALFDLIRSGVSPDNALEVLRISAEAAKAGLTDLNTTATVSTLLLDGFGLQVGDLRGAFDALIQGAHDGGATLDEFVKHAGGLLNVARAANVPFNDLVAVLTVLVDKIGNTHDAIAPLTRVISALNTTKARDSLRAIGITSIDLIEIFRQLGERGLTLNQVLDLELVGDKFVAAFATMTNNAGNLATGLDKIQKSAGRNEKALAALYDSPKERSERFNAAIQESSIQLGLLVGTGSKLQDLATKYINFSNNLQRATHGVSVEGTIANNVVSRWVASLFGIAPAAKAATGAADETATALKRAGDEAKASDAKIRQVNVDLAASSVALLAEVQALQAASSRDVADVTARADAEIAALDRGARAQATTAAATIAIQTKLAAERLTIIQKNEADVLAAVNAATAARERILRQQGTGEKQIAADIAKLRIDALAPVLKQYQDHYNALLALAQQHAARVNGIESERVEFNRGVETLLAGIRLSGLSALDEYAAKVKEIDRLISEARRAGVEGDIASAKKFTDQAIALSTSLREVVNKDGQVVIRGYEAQATSVDRIKKAAEGYNDALNLQDDLAKKGLDTTKNGIAEVLPKLQELQGTYAELKKSVAEGLAVKVAMDQDSVNAALATINELTKPRVVPITLQTTEGSAAGGLIGKSFNRGGQVGRVIEAAQRFTGGGSVFRRPPWNKVPGSGDGDTVPALLSEGSFVVRKAASRFYGDGLMRSIAAGIRKFAGGGFINIGGVNWNIAERVLGTPTSAPMIDPKRGFQSGDSFQTNDPPQQFDVRKVPDALITARNVIAYAQEMLHSIGTTNPLLGNLGQVMLELMRRIDRDPTDTQAISELLLGAQTIGTNPAFFAAWGKTQSAKGKLTPTWFYDWLQENRGGDLERAGRGFAGGGSSGTDTVRALLTPGEYVINRSRVGQLGLGFMHALNNMRVSREMLSAIAFPQAPQPSVARFATGGLVGPAVAPSNGRAGPSGGGAPVYNINVTAAAGAMLSEDNVRRFIIPVLNNINRRGR